MNKKTNRSVKEVNRSKENDILMNTIETRKKNCGNTSGRLKTTCEEDQPFTIKMNGSEVLPCMSKKTKTENVEDLHSNTCSS